METTEQAPRVPISSFKRTKIIATLGPSTNSYKAIHALIDSGANGIRLNFSHGTHEERLVQIPWIRKASHDLGKPVAIIQDLQGPKIRLGDFQGSIDVSAGQRLSFGYLSNYAQSGHIPTQYDLSLKVKKGERLYLFDGRLRTRVTGVRSGIVYVEAENHGVLLQRKGINMPDTDFGGDILTPKDLKDIAFGAKQDIDYVALSFVQTAEDIEKLRKILKRHRSTALVIAKLETKAAADNIEAIIQAADVVMVARGDLAVEISAERVPVIQRKIVGLGQTYAKPTIVATQMLLSMVDSPEPTRAEVSDVATSVFIGADCVMLSDETASGDYPIEAVQTMKRIIIYAERNPPLKVTYPFEQRRSVQNAISDTVMNLADSIDATAIMAETKSGATARLIAARRPHRPLIAVTDDPRVACQLTIVYGVKSYVRDAHLAAAKRVTDWLLEKGAFKKGDIMVVVSGAHPGLIGTTDTIKVRLLE